MTPLIVTAARSILPWFEVIVGDTTPQHGSILPSELLLFLATCRTQGVLRVVESGRRFGYSTEILARSAEHLNLRVASIDLEPIRQADARLADYGRLSLFAGRAQDHLESIVRLADPGHVAVLLDGPKHEAAMQLFAKVESRLSFAAFHDVPKSHAFRDTLRNAVDQVWFSDDDSWLAEFGHFDVDLLRFRGYECHDQLLAENNVLAIVPAMKWRPLK